MRPIDADALIEKCGDWYVEEGTESGFIGTLKNLLATEPTIQSQSTTGQLNDGARSTAQSTDLIDRQAALDALRRCQTYLYDARDPELKIELSSADAAIKELPTIQPEKAQLSKEGTTSDLISRQQAIDALDCINGVEEVLRSLPSVQPERKKGEWSDGYRWQRCSLCNQKGKKSWNFCPNCGAKMTISTK